LLQEKAVKAESKRVEALMKKLAAQQVQREKDEGQKRLEEALIKAREEFMLEQAEAVQQAREEECMIATEEAKRVAQVEEDKRKQLILAAEKEKQVDFMVQRVFLKIPVLVPGRGWIGTKLSLKRFGL